LAEQSKEKLPYRNQKDQMEITRGNTFNMNLIMQQLADGKTLKQIAAEIGKSEQALKNKMKHIRKHLDAKTTHQAVANAVRTKFVS
jgi:DNA-binding NarL/FixJ family response regulator